MSKHENQVMVRYQSGLGNSAAYQVSGFPQVNVGTGSLEINYDNVTSQVTVANNHDTTPITASFDGGTGFVLPAERTVTLNIKCRQVAMTGTNSWSVCAALTSIDKDALPEP